MAEAPNSSSSVATQEVIKAPQRWVKRYIAAWLASYVIFSIAHGLLTDLRPPNYSHYTAVQKAVSQFIIALGPWLLGMAFGVLPATISLALAWNSGARRRVFLWTDLVSCWLFVTLALYATWKYSAAH